MISDFAPHAADCGFTVSLPLLADGQLHRVNWLPDSGTGKPGWYVAHDHGSWAVVVWGDWRTGWQETWTSKSATRLTQAERAQAKAYADRARAEEAKARAKARSSASRWAERMWNDATPMEVAGEGHPYLTRKLIAGNGMRLGKHDDLLIPLRDGDGNVRNLQRIFPDGAKRFVRDAGVSGLWWRTGPAPGPDWTGDLVVTEGAATAATVRALSGLTVFAAMNAENLPRVTAWMRDTWKGARILIAADDDRCEKDGTPRPVEKNTGRKAAAKAAEDTRALIVLPVWDNLGSKGTDWNDLVGEETEARVRDKWRNAVAIAALDRQAATMTDEDYARRRAALAAAYAAAGAGRMGQREMDARRRATRVAQPEDEDTPPITMLARAATKAELWHDQFSHAYATVEMNGVMMNVRVEGQQFSDWLRMCWEDDAGGAPPPSRETFATIIGQVAATARARSDQHQAHYRMAVDADGVRWLDLGRPDRTAVRLEAAGWQIVEAPGVKFVRGDGDCALPVPVREPKLDGLQPLWDLINVAPEDRCLIAGWLLGAMRPDAPCFGLNLHGAQGTAKSTATRILRRILDPNPGLTQSLSERRVDDLALTCLDQWIPCFENISYLEDEVQDALCALTTGMAIKNRKLYSDATIMTHVVQRPWIINGINNVCSRNDLAERAVPVGLMAIPPGNRRTEREMEAKFNKVLPHLLAVMLDAAVAAEKDMPLAKDFLARNNLSHRMADALEWITAGEQALGFHDGDFIRRLDTLQEESGQEAMEGHPVISALENLLSQNSRGVWIGTHEQILLVLEDYVGKGNWPRGVPSDSKSLGHWFKREAGRLRKSFGIDVGERRQIRTGRAREWRREVRRLNGQETTHPPHDDADFL